MNAGLLLCVSLLTGCTATVKERVVALEYDPVLLKKYDVPPPPVVAEQYTAMPWTVKEDLWVSYTNSLLVVIGKNHADKEGLTKAQQEFNKKIEELNKKDNPK